MEKLNENTLGKYGEILIDGVNISPALEVFSKSGKFTNKEIIVDGIDISSLLNLNKITPVVNKTGNTYTTKINSDKVVLGLKICKSLVMRAIGAGYDSFAGGVISENI